MSVPESRHKEAATHGKQAYVHCVKTVFNRVNAPRQALPNTYLGFNRLFYSTSFNDFTTAVNLLLKCCESAAFRH